MKRTALLLASGVVLAALFLTSAVFIANAPLEPVQGLIQKIMYYKVPLAWLLMLATLVCAGASLKNLFSPSLRADALARASVQIGVLTGACVLITGSLWAKKAWGTWWVWDARLTTSLLLWIILLSYLLARSYGGLASEKLSAALGLFAGANVPLVYVSSTWWRTLHPTNQVVPSLNAPMRLALYTSLIPLLAVCALLVAVAVAIIEANRRMDNLAMELEDLSEGVG